jgi:nitroreductase
MEDFHVELVRKATRAPSSHNTQPWLFRVQDGAVQLHADRSRALPANDPDDRELTISCGAALFNLEAAAAQMAKGTATILLPEPANCDYFARVSFTGQPDRERGDLADAISVRRSTRDAFEDRPVPPELESKLVALAERRNACHLTPVEKPHRNKVVELIAKGDKAQFDDENWRLELASWVRPRNAGDGLTAPKFAVPVARTVIRHVDLGSFVAGNDEDLARDAPLLMILWSERDEPKAWLETGRLLEEASLCAARLDVQVGFLNQPCQVAELRPRLAQILGIPGFPQIVVRLGRASDADQLSPRRPVQDVLLSDGS